ncbi:MAG: S1C family serine protease [Mycobacteriales bacterium]
MDTQQGGSGTERPGQPDQPDQPALDAYSRVVTGVAEQLLPHVASLRVWLRRGSVANTAIATGSAVVLTDDGFLVTNAHVVDGGRNGVAAFGDGTEVEFDVVGADPLSDLAVVRARGTVPARAEFGDADQLKVGQLVVAVGSPLGLVGSVTAGVVSGLRRSLPTRDGGARRLVEDVIQTDAVLNPGNSGGALADSSARVVGINTAVAGIGLGLAVPVNGTTRRILATLLREGRVRRGYLGVVGMPVRVPPALADRTATGDQVVALRIVDVVVGSPAARAGLVPGDLVLAAAGTPIDSTQALQGLLFGESIGEPFPMTVARHGALTEVIAIPADLTG